MKRSAVEEDRSSGRHVIFLGDLNIAHTRRDIHPALLSTSSQGHGYTEEEIAWLDRLLRSRDDDPRFVDCWRRSHPDLDNVFTVWDWRKQARAVNHGVRCVAGTIRSFPSPFSVFSARRSSILF